MAEMTIKGAVQNTRNNITDADGYALPPLAANLKEGQIAVNTCETDPCIFFKTSEGKIVKIVSEEKLTKALTDILGNSAADLDTLRELIAQFEGSANDILPMLVALTDRVSAAETALGNKANSSTVNAHINNTSNPHGVTASQVGLGNVRNIEQLGKMETAADSSKLGGRLAADFWHKGNNLIVYPNNTNVDNIDSSLWCSSMYLSGEGIPSHLSYSQVYQLGTSYNGAGLQFAQYYGSANSNLKFRTKSDSPSAHWNDWFTLYHAGNSNNTTADWAANTMNANSFVGTNLALSGNAVIQNNQVWHAGNSNNDKADWTCKNFYANGKLLYNPWVTNQQMIAAGGTDTDKTLFVGNNTVQRINMEAYSYDAVFIKDSNGKIWNAGNSNKSDVDWAANVMKANRYTGNHAGGNLYISGNDGAGENKSAGDLHIQGGRSTGTGGSGSIAFWTAPNQITAGSGLSVLQNRLIITGNGNVGINNPNPTERLDVDGNIKTTNIYTTNLIIDKHTFHTHGLYGSFTTRHKGGDSWQGGFVVYGDVTTPEHINKFGLFTHYQGALRIGTNWRGGLEGLSSTYTPIEISPSIGENSLFIKTNGYIGFGTNNPLASVHAKGIVRTDAFYMTNSGSVDIDQWLLQARGSTIAGVYKYANGNLILSTNNANRLIVTKDGNVCIGDNHTPTEKLTVEGNGLFSGNVTAKGDIIAKKSGAVTFSTSDAAAGATRLNDLIDVKLPTNLADKMVLAYDPAQVNSDGSKGGYTFMPSAGTGTGTVSSAEIASLPDHNHNDIGYVSASDERLKENIVPLTGALNILLHFKPKQYTWNAEGNRLGLNDPRAYGLIAQEAAELKDIVDIVRPMNTSEEYLGVDYVKIVPILIAGVQEQHKEIIALNQKLKTIQARANKAYGNETNNADEIANLKADNITLKAEIEELKMLIKKQ